MKKVSIALVCCLAASQPLLAQKEEGSQDRAHAAGRSRKAAVSFRRDLLPLFRDNCTMCHQGDIPMGALSLTPDVAYQSLVGIQASQADMQRVVAGNPDRSYLYYKISGRNALVKGGGVGMPWGAPLSPADIDLVRRWIRQGARDN